MSEAPAGKFVAAGNWVQCISCKRLRKRSDLNAYTTLVGQVYECSDRSDCLKESNRPEGA